MVILGYLVLFYEARMSSFNRREITMLYKVKVAKVLYDHAGHPSRVGGSGQTFFCCEPMRESVSVDRIILGNKGVLNAAYIQTVSGKVSFIRCPRCEEYMQILAMKQRCHLKKGDIKTFTIHASVDAWIFY